MVPPIWICVLDEGLNTRWELHTNIPPENPPAPAYELPIGHIAVFPAIREIKKKVQIGHMDGEHVTFISKQNKIKIKYILSSVINSDIF